MRWLRGLAAEIRKLPFKDKATVSLSSLAFLVSIGTAYFTLMQIADDIRVVIESFPFVIINETGDALTTRGPFTAIYINSGNRPAALKGESYFIDQKGRRCSDAKDEPGVTAILLSDLEPFVVRQNEVAVKTSRFAVPIFPAPDAPEVVSIALTEENKAAEQFKVTVCISFTLSTPSISHIFTTAKEIRFQLNKNKTITFDHPGGYFGVMENRPIILHRRRTNILFE